MDAKIITGVQGPCRLLRVLWLEEDLLGQFQEVAEAPPRSPSSELLGDLHVEGMTGSLPLCFSSLLDAEDLQNQLQGGEMRSGERPLQVQGVGEALTHSPCRLDSPRAVGGHPLNGCHALFHKIAALLRMQAREVDVQIAGRRRTSFRTCWGRVEELLVAGELWNDHKKAIFFPLSSAATCTNRPLGVELSLFDSSIVFLLVPTFALHLDGTKLEASVDFHLFFEERALKGTMFTPEQFLRLSSTKASICPGKIVYFSQLTGRLKSVEETLAAMGWSRLCQISEPTFQGALKAFYLSLQITVEGLVTGSVKGTTVTVSEELLVELLDFPNCGHNISEVESMEKQKFGVIGSLGSITKKGLLVNELSIEKRILHSIITNIITPKAEGQVCQGDLSDCRDIPEGRVLVAVWAAVTLRLVMRHPAPSHFGGRRLKALAGTPFPFLSFSFPFSPRGKAFLYRDPDEERGGVGGGSCGAWSSVVERGGGVLAVVKSLWVSVLPKSVDVVCVVTPGCSIPAVCLPSDVATAVRVATSEETSLWVLVTTRFPAATERLLRLPFLSQWYRDGLGRRNSTRLASGVSVASLACRRESVATVAGYAFYERGCWFAHAMVEFFIGLHVRVGVSRRLREPTCGVAFTGAGLCEVLPEFFSVGSGGMRVSSPSMTASVLVEVFVVLPLWFEVSIVWLVVVALPSKLRVEVCYCCVGRCVLVGFPERCLGGSGGGLACVVSEVLLAVEWFVFVLGYRCVAPVVVFLFIFEFLGCTGGTSCVLVVGWFASLLAPCVLSQMVV
ncbi:hypothetical protein Taro_011750 [Colocasia esculenta]|uniref:Uncharacterized protein n=1 Tax=Colocasia esculenta TaxID=4460 RepID=A0A843U276_COLES|nr:hypothetical protein [Colocasia esculenta]